MKISMLALCAIGIVMSCAYAHPAKHKASHVARQNASAASHKSSSSSSSVDKPEPASNY
jgi:hypothetical protein